MTSLLQNNYTLSSLLNNKSFQKDFTASSLTDNKDKVEFPLDFIDFNNRTFTIGQWIDVKDTVNQWLEAEVIDKVKILGPIRNYDKIKVHYLGWGEHWDEWIDSYSVRIMPFRYYTNERYSKRLCPNARIISSLRNDTILKELKELDFLLSETNNLNSSNSRLTAPNFRKISSNINFNSKDGMTKSHSGLTLQDNQKENDLLLVEDSVNSSILNINATSSYNNINNMNNRSNLNNNVNNDSNINMLTISNSNFNSNKMLQENNISSLNKTLSTSTINRISNSNIEDSELKNLSVTDILSSMSK